MSTHNMCFCGEIRKISPFFNEKSTLSVAMYWLMFTSNILGLRLKENI